MTKQKLEEEFDKLHSKNFNNSSWQDIGLTYKLWWLDKISQNYYPKDKAILKAEVEKLDVHRIVDKKGITKEYIALDKLNQLKER